MYFDTVLLLILVSCGYYIRKCARINFLGTFSHITGKYQYLPCNILLQGKLILTLLPERFYCALAAASMF